MLAVTSHLLSTAHMQIALLRLRDIARTCWIKLRRLRDPYRPELHYMRGPGPKFREKRGLTQSQAVTDRARKR
jgi:hypothetical protein